jgi:hypothetical protein
MLPNWRTTVLHSGSLLEKSKDDALNLISGRKAVGSAVAFGVRLGSQQYILSYNDNGFTIVQMR